MHMFIFWGILYSYEKTEHEKLFNASKRKEFMKISTMLLTIALGATLPSFGVRKISKRSAAQAIMTLQCADYALSLLKLYEHKISVGLFYDMIIVDSETGQTITTLRVRNVHAQAQLYDGRIACLSNDEIQLWDFRADTPCEQRWLHPGAQHIKQLQDGRLLITGNDVQIFNLGTHQTDLMYDGIDWNSSVLELQNGHIAFGRGGNSMIWNPDTGKVDQSFDRILLQLQDGSFVFRDPGSCNVWWRQGKEIRFWKTGSAMYSLMQLQDGRVAGTSGNLIMVENKSHWLDHGGRVFSLTQLDDGKLVSASNSGNYLRGLIKIWSKIFIEPEYQLEH